jgi:hypothetical protein
MGETIRPWSATVGFRPASWDVGLSAGQSPQTKIRAPRPRNGREIVLVIIYTLLLGTLCACFVEAGSYAFYPYPELEQMIRHRPRELTPEEEKEAVEIDARNKVLREPHSLRHYVISLLGSIALTQGGRLGILADGILLGGVFTIGTGTCFGIMGGGRVARFAVATMSLAAALVLGYVKFLPGR